MSAVAQGVSERMPIAREHDVVSVRRRARDLAVGLGFDTFATAAITTATSELARNVWIHGGGGHVVLETVTRDGRRGLRLTFIDQGCGITNLHFALQGGHGTGRSLGLGLSGSRRLVDEFSVDTESGRGTTVVVVKWARFPR